MPRGCGRRASRSARRSASRNDVSAPRNVGLPGLRRRSRRLRRHAAPVSHGRLRRPTTSDAYARALIERAGRDIARSDERLRQRRRPSAEDAPLSDAYGRRAPSSSARLDDDAEQPAERRRSAGDQECASGARGLDRHRRPPGPGLAARCEGSAGLLRRAEHVPPGRRAALKWPSRGTATTAGPRRLEIQRHGAASPCSPGAAC